MATKKPPLTLSQPSAERLINLSRQPEDAETASEANGPELKTALDQMIEQKAEMDRKSASGSAFTPSWLKNKRGASSSDDGAQDEKARNRKWDKEHKAYAFRNVPKEVQERILDIAEHLRETSNTVGGASAVASVLLDYALSEYRAGRLQINSSKPTTLGWATPEWTEKEHAKAKPRRAKTKKVYSAVVAYRLLDEQVAAIKKLIEKEEEHAQPTVIDLKIGDVFTQLISCALKAYEENRLILTTETKSTRVLWGTHRS